MPPKKKGEKISLGNFLADQNYGNWADEMEDAPLPSTNRDSSRQAYGSGFGGNRDFSAYARADMSDRGPRDQLPLPTRPPYTAHLGNLSFDVTMADIEDFFAGCETTSVRIVEDKIEQKPKGFGYVEFRTLDGLKKALDLNGAQFQGRNVRISVAEPPKDREPGRELDWGQRKGPMADLPERSGGVGMGPRRPSGRGFEAARGFDAASDAGSERGGSRRGAPSFEGDGKVRDFGNWERRGPLTPSIGAPQSAGGPDTLRRNDRSFDRRGSPSWGEGTGRAPPSSDGGSRPPRRDISERPTAPPREPTASEQDSQWRTRMQPDKPAASNTPTPDISMPSSPVAPASRPRLNLTKRNVSNAPTDDAAPATSATDSKASPFGAAKPIDTAKRDQEFEARQAEKRKEKEEADAKAKEEREKAAAEKAAKGEAAGSASQAAVEGGATGAVAEPRAVNGGRRSSANKAGKNAKENGDYQPKPDFKILQRMQNTDEGDLEAEDGDDMRNEPANGAIVGSDEKDVKPQEIVRDVNDPEPETTAEQQQEEGWNVVGGKERTSKSRGKPRGPSSRALAS